MAGVYNLPVSFRFSGDVEKAQQLTGQARKYLGLLSESMGFANLKFLTREFQDGEGNLYRCTINAIGLAPIVTVEIMAVGGGAEDVITGFVARMTIKKSVSDFEYTDIFNLRVKSPDDNVIYANTFFNEDYSYNELAQLSVSENGNYKLESNQFHIDHNDITDKEICVYPGTAENKKQINGEFQTSTFSEASDPGLSTPSNCQNGASPFYTASSSWYSTENIYPPELADTEGIPEPVSYGWTVEITYENRQCFFSAPGSTFVHNQVVLGSLQLSEAIGSNERDVIANNILLKKHNNDYFSGYAPTLITELKENPKVRFFRSDYRYKNGKVAVRHYHESEDFICFACAIDGTQNYAFSDTGEWASDYNHSQSFDWKYYLEYFMNWGIQYLWNSIVYDGSNTWSGMLNSEEPSNQITVIDSFLPVKSEWHIKTSLQEGDYEIDIFVDKNITHSEIEAEVDLLLFTSQGQAKAKKTFKIANNLSDKKFVVSVKKQGLIAEMVKIKPNI